MLWILFSHLTSTSQLTLVHALSTSKSPQLYPSCTFSSIHFFLIITLLYMHQASLLAPHPQQNTLSTTQQSRFIITLLFMHQASPLAPPCQQLNLFFNHYDINAPAFFMHCTLHPSKPDTFPLSFHSLLHVLLLSSSLLFHSTSLNKDNLLSSPTALILASFWSITFITH